MNKTTDLAVYCFFIETLYQFTPLSFVQSKKIIDILGINHPEAIEGLIDEGLEFYPEHSYFSRLQDLLSKSQGK